MWHLLCVGYNEQLSTGSNAKGNIAAQANVLDGLALAGKDYPYDVDGLPALSSGGNVFTKVVDEIRDVLDAVGDLTMAESIYQLSLGNTDRSAATLDAIAQGAFHPEPEVIKTQRSGNTVTHRLMIAMPSFAEGKGPEKAQQEGFSTPAAEMEPSLNNWLAGLPAFSHKVGVTVKVTYKAGAGNNQDEVNASVITDPTLEVPPSNSSIVHNTHWLYLTDLGSSPLELLNIIKTANLVKGSVLDNLISNKVIELFYFNASKSDLFAVDVNYNSGEISLASIAPYCEELLKLVKNSRPTRPGDWVYPNENTNTDPWWGVDRDNLVSRLNKALSRLEELLEPLNKYASEQKEVGWLSPAAYGDLWQVLSAASSYMGEALPVWSISEADLGTHIKGVNRELRSRYERAFAIADSGPNVERLLEAGALLFGNAFPLLPIYTLPHPEEVVPAFESTTITRRLANHASNPMVMEEWLHGLSLVNDKVRCLTKVSQWNDLLCDLLEEVDGEEEGKNEEGKSGAYTDLQFVPAQFPEIHPNEQWIGGEYNTLEGFAPVGDKLSIALHFDSVNLLEAPQCGLLIDEWSEVIPNRDQTTAVAFHYDQPNSEPPQAILLAVAPKLSAPTWSLQDLLDVVNETFDMAKKRAIEPDDLFSTSLATVLPAVAAPTAPLATTITLPFRDVNGSSPFQEQALNL